MACGFENTLKHAEHYIFERNLSRFEFRFIVKCRARMPQLFSPAIDSTAKILMLKADFYCVCAFHLETLINCL